MLYVYCTECFEISSNYPSPHCDTVSSTHQKKPWKVLTEHPKFDTVMSVLLFSLQNVLGKTVKRNVLFKNHISRRVSNFCHQICTSACSGHQTIIRQQGGFLLNYRVCPSYAPSSAPHYPGSHIYIINQVYAIWPLILWGSKQTFTALKQGRFAESVKNLALWLRVINNVGFGVSHVEITIQIKNCRCVFSVNVSNPQRRLHGSVCVWSPQQEFRHLSTSH